MSDTPMGRIVGKWPGDETEEQITEALEQLGNCQKCQKLQDLLRWRDVEKEPPKSLQKILLLDPDAKAVEVGYWHGDFFSYRGLFNWKYWRPIGPLSGGDGR